MNELGCAFFVVGFARPRQCYIHTSGFLHDLDHLDHLDHLDRTYMYRDETFLRPYSMTSRIFFPVSNSPESPLQTTSPGESVSRLPACLPACRRP